MEKLGMRSEGLLRETRRLDETWWDECVYAILEREFAARLLQ
jgi:RimJ/RimL family protein N-acetyltransferase